LLLACCNFGWGEISGQSFQIEDQVVKLLLLPAAQAVGGGDKGLADLTRSRQGVMHEVAVSPTNTSAM
jgi:hypothetical protein